MSFKKASTFDWDCHWLALFKPNKATRKKVGQGVVYRGGLQGHWGYSCSTTRFLDRRAQKHQVQTFKMLRADISSARLNRHQAIVWNEAMRSLTACHVLQVMAFNLPDFWLDIGNSVGEFHDFNVRLARDELPFSLQQPLDTPFFHM